MMSSGHIERVLRTSLKGITMTHQLQDRYIVRMPTGMRETIKKEAAKNHRSMNAEIIHHLSKVFDETKTKKADALA